MPIAKISNAIRTQLTAWPLFLNAKRVFSYYPIRQEIDFSPLIAQFPEKSWFLPRVSEHGDLIFLPYTANQALEKSRWNIMEPMLPANPSAIVHGYSEFGAEDLMLMPGLCFDQAGFRLGYGKGFYDRFLGALVKHEKHLTTVGALPEALLEANLPIDPWDTAVDWLLTENRLFRSTQTQQESENA